MSETRIPDLTPHLCETTAVLESIDHPAECAEWDDLDCDCGIRRVLRLLWEAVGASDEGHVLAGHPLESARRAQMFGTLR